MPRAASAAPAGDDYLLTTEQVVARLQLSKTKIWQLVRAGELPCVRIGTAMRFRPADLRAFVDRHLGQPL